LWTINGTTGYEEARSIIINKDINLDEHKLIREAAREWVKKEISPIIEDACQKARSLIKRYLLPIFCSFFLE